MAHDDCGNIESVGKAIEFVFVEFSQTDKD